MVIIETEFFGIGIDILGWNYLATDLNKIEI